ncbi:NERD domain-containing protein/DEAD/DEAH box helicase [Blastococcus capsensis]|uniref:NERD domain-containing protein/DEAD/DEAH box helicase n=1 Tax=Blastococcus capsensis TaxID=1564163 RepID=UPI00254159B0|nr:NERD domain-containing protein/DEAD/DEAH box helicase [Blastococcus capsensis]MDK3256585.1 NERD domain-containing protein/DEAD/DEAH box helicase [Blastococcus capsensis]
MTARLFPDDPQFGHASEELFVRTLREQLPNDAALFCNVRLSDRSQDREADVVVAWPGVGVAAIEVKGGHVTLQRGEWRQAGDGTDRVIHPVDQAVACKYLLCGYLAEHPRWTASRPRAAHLVALPATTLASDFMAPGLARWMAIDTTDVPHAAARIRAALDKVRDEPEPPTAEDVEALVDCLAGTAIPQQHLLAELAEREAACDLLTRDQAKVLDLLVSFDRVEIRGGAGSGKTWLAVEKARRLAADGQRVALMCYSRGLAEFLRRRVERLPKRQRPVYVGTFHNLGIGWASSRARTTTAATGRSSCLRPWCPWRRSSRRASGSTRSSSTRGRTSPRAGGTPSWRRCVTPTRARCTSSPTRGSASSRGRAGRPST